MNKSLECVLRDGGAFFRCPRCGHEQVINQDQPLVRQLREVTDRHRCTIELPEQSMPLTLVHPVREASVTTRS